MRAKPETPSVTLRFAGTLDGYVKYGDGKWETGDAQYGPDRTVSIGACASFCTDLPGCTAFSRSKETGYCYTYTKTPTFTGWTPDAAYDSFLRGASYVIGHIPHAQRVAHSTRFSTWCLALAILGTGLKTLDLARASRSDPMSMPASFH